MSRVSLFTLLSLAIACDTFDEEGVLKDFYELDSLEQEDNESN